MHPLAKQDEFSQLQGSLNIGSSSAASRETSSAQRLHTEIKPPSCRDRAVAVPAPDPAAPAARGHADSRSPHPSPRSSFGTALGTWLPAAEPGAVTLTCIPVPAKDLGHGTARAVGALLPAG